MSEVARERNRRGEGSKLRADILAGATAILEETGSEESVTLRAIARRVGISAPSIYTHFPDRAAIVETIVDGAFAEFNAAIAAAIASARGTLAKLQAGCAAYLRFAWERPNRYLLLFERRHPIHDGMGAVPEMRTEAFDALVRVLQQCVDEGISASEDPVGDAAAIWAALHGFATLHAGFAGFPWPDTDSMVDRIAYGLGRIDARRSG